jgi:MscS family membrane protein
MRRQVLIVIVLLLAVACPVGAQNEEATTAPEPSLEDAAAPQTGAAAAKLPSQPTFGLDQVGALQHELMGYPLWQYAASLLWVVLAFLVAAIIDWLMTHQIRRLAAKTKTDLDDKLLKATHGPVKIAIMLLMLNAGIHMFQWPDWAEKILSVLFVIAVAATVVYLAMRLVDVLVEYAERRFFGGDAQLAKLMMPVLAKSLKAFVIIIGALTAAQVLGLPITSVIAGLGIGGIAVALAAQSTLANVFGTITILADRPFKVGDRVQIDKFDGTVEAIGLRSTRIRTLDGHLVTLPNKVVADSGINNITMRPNIRQLITLSLTYDTKPEKMQEAVAILREIFLKHPLTHDAWIYWRDYASASLDIFIVYWCKSTVYKEFLQTMEELNLEVKRRFDAAGLDFAFPTQTIHLRTENKS